MTRGDAAAELAKSWLGTPYRHQGAGPYSLDCVGLLIVVGQALGVVPAGYAPPLYRRVTDGKAVRVEIERFCEPADGWAPGRVVILNILGIPQHTGICSMVHGQQGIIHAAAKHRQVVQEPLGDGWVVLGYFAFPGEADAWNSP